ncbi:LOW QUALITY PROTEIN: LuxR family transcriptional regulator, partial [Streptomyces viridochromogenes DSM 40736]
MVSIMATTDATGTEPAITGIDPTGDPLLRTRFALPERPATFLRRTRLVRHLDQALVTPLTMVNGSAGAGKTLLVADWAASLPKPVAWLTTDTTVQAPGVFWAYLLEALRATGVPVAGDVGCPAEAGRVDQRTLTCLAADLENRDHTTVVVLDEFDRVTSPEIAEQLEFVLRHAGRGLRLVLVTRTEPLLPLHRYRASCELTEIRDAELAFTSEEAHELLSRHGLHLPASAVRALVGRTQGWAAGLSLCALAARQGPDPQAYVKQFEADHSTVADYLLAEVLDRQPPGTQDLLLRISVLDRFCPDLVNALTQRGDAEPILAALHRENAFVHYLGHSWYSLHPLFAEILRAHLRERLPGLEPELRGRAARWLRRSGALPDALVQGAAADDWEFTTRAVVDDLAIGQLFTGLRSEDLSALFARMGSEVRGPAPDLVRAARELARHDLDHGLTHLRRAEEQLAGDGTDPARGRLSCALLEVLAGRLTGSPGRAERAAEQAWALRKDVPAQLLDEHPELTALLLAHLGAARLWAGRFDDARSALSAVAGHPGGAAMALPRWEALGQLALIDYLNGWPGRAEHKARAAAGQAEHYSLPHRSGAGTGPVVLAAVHIDRDELDEAQALLDAADGSPSLVEDPVWEAGRTLTRGRLLLARGDARGALTAAEAIVPAAASSPWGAGPQRPARVRRPPGGRAYRARREGRGAGGTAPDGLCRRGGAGPPRGGASRGGARHHGRPARGRPARPGGHRPRHAGTSPGRPRDRGRRRRPPPRRPRAARRPARAAAPAVPGGRTLAPPAAEHRQTTATGRGLARLRSRPVPRSWAHPAAHPGGVRPGPGRGGAERPGAGRAARTVPDDVDAGDRRRPPSLREHREDPPQEHLPQARGEPPRRRRAPRPRPAPAV